MGSRIRGSEEIEAVLTVRASVTRIGGHTARGLLSLLGAVGEGHGQEGIHRFVRCGRDQPESCFTHFQGVSS
jgi:hypothetical protein